MSEASHDREIDLIAALKDIDPQVLGLRIHDLRAQRRLTQRQLAAGRISVGYMSRIESGHRRPDAEVLTYLASKLEVTPAALLAGDIPGRANELRVVFDHAELEVSAGNHAKALELLDAVTEEPGDDADVLAQGHYVRALALEGSGELRQAAQTLTPLLGRSRNPLFEARAAIALSRCLRESGDLAGAITQTEDVRSRLHELGLSGTAEAVQLTVTVAAAYYELGSRDHARELCAQAVTESEQSGSAIAQASALWNASVIESSRGATSAALPLAERALVLMEESANARNVARMRTLYGILLLEADPPDLPLAEEHLTRAATEYGWSSAGPIDVQRNQLALARLDYGRGNLDQALVRSEGVHAATRGEAPLLSSSALILSGKVLHAQGDTAQAARRLRQAIMELNAVRADHRVAQTWVELGEQLESVGETEAALDCFRRAAASAGLHVGMPAPASSTRAR